MYLNCCIFTVVSADVHFADFANIIHYVSMNETITLLIGLLKMRAHVGTCTRTNVHTYTHAQVNTCTRANVHTYIYVCT